MPSEMLERCARAVLRCDAGDGPLGESLAESEARAIVRAVLRELREPDEGMVDQGLASTAGWLDIKGSQLTVNREKMRRRFARMIDHVLSEEKTDAG